MARALDRCDDPGGPGRRWWTLDPVDGTKGFLRNEQYAVALALIEDGEVVLAVIGCPNLPLTGEPGEPGRSAACSWPSGSTGASQMVLAATSRPRRDRRAIRVAVRHPGRRATARYAESVEAAHSDQDESARIGGALGITAEPLRLDSQAKYAVVARGDASIYLRIAARRLPGERLGPRRGLAHRGRGGRPRVRRGGRPLDFTHGYAPDRATAASWPRPPHPRRGPGGGRCHA